MKIIHFHLAEIGASTQIPALVDCDCCVDELAAVGWEFLEPGSPGSTRNGLSDFAKGVIFSKRLPFYAVLMDSWYASQMLMAYIDQWGKIRHYRE